MYDNARGWGWHDVHHGLLLETASLVPAEVSWWHSLQGWTLPCGGEEEVTVTTTATMAPTMSLPWRQREQLDCATRAVAAMSSHRRWAVCDILQCCFNTLGHKFVQHTGHKFVQHTRIQVCVVRFPHTYLHILVPTFTGNLNLTSNIHLNRQETTLTNLPNIRCSCLAKTSHFSSSKLDH